MSRARRREWGQAIVEFALVAPMLILIMLVVLDFGFGLFMYSEMATGAREAARQAVLQYNASSNTAAGTCSSCVVPGVMPQLQSEAGIGYPVVYAQSSSSTSPPSYGTCPTTPCVSTVSGRPPSLSLSSTAVTNQVYVFIYELNTGTGVTTWDAGQNPIRNGGGRLVVVDLKIKWQPTVLTYAGIGSSMTLDAQTVSREEW